MKKTPILFDCDTGTDDAVAIVAALGCEALDVRAFTTVTGNVHLSHTAPNTLNLVRYLGYDIPVVKGAADPIVRKYSGGAAMIHGESGLGDVVLPDAGDCFSKKTASQTIYDEAVACGGELVIVAVGPLTNIAIALMAYPDLPKYIKKIVIMGGAIHGGNHSDCAEFNITVDPEAAKKVFESGVPLVMVGLDVTMRANMDREDIDDFRKMGTKGGDFVHHVLSWIINREGTGEIADLSMHDSLALCAAVCPECVVLKDCIATVECGGTYTDGHIVNDLYKREYGWYGDNVPAATCQVAMDLDLPLFKNWLKENIAKA